MFTRQIAYQILFWTFAVIIAGHLFCPLFGLNEHWVHWVTFCLSLVGLLVVVYLRGWIHATEIECAIDPILQKLLVVRMNPARIALLDESGTIVECSGPFAAEVGAASSYDLVGKNARDFLDDPQGQASHLFQYALNSTTNRPISFLGFDSLQKQAFLKIIKLNNEYLLSLDPMKG